MQSIADLLPPEVAKCIHPAWRKNEADYWAVRDTLLAEYGGSWICFADGQVIASGRKPNEIFNAAHESRKHPFVTCVGDETRPCGRIRKVAFPYDTAYAGEALPLLEVEFRESSGTPGLQLDQVIPDTGADHSILPWSDCQALQLSSMSGVPGFTYGFAGVATTMEFKLWARLDGQDHPCRVHADFSGNERILGRDVLNRVDILFRGPAREVVINP